MQILGREVLAFNALKKSDAMLCVLKGFRFGRRMAGHRPLGGPLKVVGHAQDLTAGA